MQRSGEVTKKGILLFIHPFQRNDDEEEEEDDGQTESSKLFTAKNQSITASDQITKCKAFIFYNSRIMIQLYKFSFSISTVMFGQM